MEEYNESIKKHVREFFDKNSSTLADINVIFWFTFRGLMKDYPDKKEHLEYNHKKLRKQVLAHIKNSPEFEIKRGKHAGVWRV